MLILLNFKQPAWRCVKQSKVSQDAKESGTKETEDAMLTPKKLQEEMELIDMFAGSLPMRSLRMWISKNLNQ